MLQFAKTVLMGVSHSKELFKKELHKIIFWSETGLSNDLKSWCVTNYGLMYRDVIEEAFGHKEGECNSTFSVA